MARPVKKGLDYFSFDVDFFDDDKIQLISGEFGIKGEIIAIKLLCKIYKNGYYYPWGDDEALLFASKNNYDYNLVKEVVKRLIKRSFFNEGVFNSHKILTSRGIQSRFLEAKIKSKSCEILKEHLVFGVISEITKVNEEITKVNTESSTQRKEKESKVNKSKGERGFSPPPWDEVFVFFKERIQDTKWPEKKCKTEAQAFIDYYGKTDWNTKNGPILNWRNAANGWISKDAVFESKSGVKSGFPDFYDRQLMDKLPENPGKQEYRNHLRALGYVRKEDRVGNTIDWIKPVINTQNNYGPSGSDWKDELTKKIKI